MLLPRVAEQQTNLCQWKITLIHQNILVIITLILSVESISRYGATSSAATTPPLDAMYCPICAQDEQNETKGDNNP